MSTNPLNIQNTGRALFKKLARDVRAGGREAKLNLLHQGVVTNIDYLGTEGRARFSIQAKVLGIDSPDDDSDGKFFAPLFPIHLISMPQVGEVVFIISAQAGNIDNAYWISRSDDLNKLTKTGIEESVEAGQIDKEAQPSSDERGYVGDLPTEKNEEEPNKEYVIPEPRVKAGDVITQGRSNTFTRHTFDTKNKKGVIENVTEEQAVPDGSFYEKDFRKSDGARIIQATNSDLDTQIIEDLMQKKFDGDYTKNNGSQYKFDTAYLLLEALELRIVSRNGKKVQHAVLAEEQERWLIALIDILKNLISHIKEHKHMAQGPTSPPLEPTLSKFTEDSNKLQEHKKPIPDHHSKTLGIN